MLPFSFQIIFDLLELRVVPRTKKDTNKLHFPIVFWEQATYISLPVFDLQQNNTELLVGMGETAVQKANAWDWSGWNSEIEGWQSLFPFFFFFAFLFFNKTHVFQTDVYFVVTLTWIFTSWTTYWLNDSSINFYLIQYGCLILLLQLKVTCRTTK